MIEDCLLGIMAAAPVRPGRLHHLPFPEKAVLEQPLILKTVIQPGRGETGIAGRNYAQAGSAGSAESFSVFSLTLNFEP